MIFEPDWPPSSIVKAKKEMCGEGEEDLENVKKMYERFVKRFEEDLDVTLHPRIRRGLWEIFNSFRWRMVSRINFYKDLEEKGCVRDIREAIEEHEKILERYEIENGLRKKKDRHKSEKAKEG